MKLRIFVLLMSTLVVSLPAAAQTQSGGELDNKFSALKQASLQNQQKLHQYRWIETTQVTYKGEQKPETVKTCFYGPDGKVQKIPMSQPQPQQQAQGGKFKQRIVAKKKEETMDYMKQVQSLLSLYVPPDPQRMQRAFQEHNVSIVPGGGATQLVFKNYAQPGDQMTIAFESGAHKIQSINVNSYLDEPKDVVTLAVQFASLPDGANYPSQSVLDATAKQIKVTTTNSNYQKQGL